MIPVNKTEHAEASLNRTEHAEASLIVVPTTTANAFRQWGVDMLDA